MGRVAGRERYCLMGGEVSSSPSPAMMNAAFSELGIDATYFALSVRKEDLAREFARLKQDGIGGLNVTIPFKTAIASLLDGLDEVSARLGAVNVVELVDQRYVGHNSDVDGIIRPLKTRFPDLRLRRALLLGAGGAARAFMEAMSQVGCPMVGVMARDPSRAASFVADMARAYTAIDLELCSPYQRPRPGPVDLFFNATPGGSPGSTLPSQALELLTPGMIVFDAVYRPVETELLLRAKAVGCPVIHGYEMLLSQGVVAFELWTGREAPADVMRRAILRRLAEVGN